MIGLNNSPRAAVCVVLSLCISLFSLKSPNLSNSTAFAQAPTCDGGIGGRIYSNGGDLEVEILPSIAGFTSELSFVSPGPQRFIATNRDAGTVVKLGSFPAGVELIFSIYVRDTQQTFYSGSGSQNPDGMGHGDVTCLNKGKAKIGFEDQLGGGDRNYADLICEIRQPLSNCAYTVSPASQSFDAGGGNGTVQMVAGSGCNWSASADADWISINSGASGSASGAIRYSVAANQGADSRSGTISLDGGPVTIFQDGLGSGPVIMSTAREGKRLILYGINFDSGSVILLEGAKQKTLHDDNPRTVIIGKKLAKWVTPGDRLRVRTSTGALSPEYVYEP